MSEKNLRSASKRKAIEDPKTDGQRKNKSRLITEDTVINTPSPSAQWLPPTLRRDKRFSIPFDEWNENLPDKDIFDHTNANHSDHESGSNNLPSSSSSNGQDAAVPDVSSPPNDNHTTLSLQNKDANLSTPSSHSTSISAEDTFNVVRQYPTPADFQPNITKPNIIKPITASVSRRPLQEIELPGPPKTPKIDDKHSVYNRSFTIIDDDDNNPNKEHGPSSSKDLVPHWVASRRRARPPPQSGSPTLSDPPLQSDSRPQSDSPPQHESQSYTHSLGDNDHSASLPSGPFNELGAYTPFNAAPSSDVFSPTSSGFQPNIDMPGGGYPSSTPVIPVIRIGHVEQITTALVHAVRNHCKPPFNSNHHADYSINAYQQPDSPVGANQQPTPTLETDQQPNNTVGDYQQPKQTIGDLLQQAAHALDAEQQAAHALDAEQQAAHTLDAHQQVGPTANDVSGEGLRLRFINLHLRHMELLETEMNNLAPFRTLLHDEWVNDGTEGSDRFERNFPSYKIAQDRFKALSDNFLKSSDATARPFAL